MGWVLFEWCGVRGLNGLRKAVAAFVPHCATAVQRGICCGATGLLEGEDLDGVEVGVAAGTSGAEDDDGV